MTTKNTPALRALTQLGDRITLHTAKQNLHETGVFEHPQYISTLDTPALDGLTSILRHPLIFKTGLTIKIAEAHIEAWHKTGNKVGTVALTKGLPIIYDNLVKAEFIGKGDYNRYQPAIRAIVAQTEKGKPAHYGKIQLGRMIGGSMATDHEFLLADHVLSASQEVPGFDDRVTNFLNTLGAAVFAVSTKRGISYTKKTQRAS